MIRGKLFKRPHFGKLLYIFMIVLIMIPSWAVVPSGTAVAASGPKLQEKKVTIGIDKKDYKVKVLNVDKQAVVRFTSSDKSILKVSKKTGKVTPVAEGTAKVTVKIKLNGKTVKLKQKITITSTGPSAGKDPVTDKDRELTVGAFSQMMSDVIEKADPSLTAKWKKIAKKTFSCSDKLRRIDAKLILYEAACVLGIGNYSLYWCNYQQGYDGAGISSCWEINRSLFDNSNDPSPFEITVNEPGELNYAISAISYAYGQSSPVCDEPFFKPAQKDGDDTEVITESEGKTAAERLYQAYCFYYEGYFDINDYATDWSDPALSEAAALKDAIINSKTTIKKSSVFIQGETYTGNAYYVSNSGDDSNDGLSPDKAWATMERVTKADLAFGDAVFFERGGRWYGRLLMRDGVTYSAYGEGPKPIWSGSPLDAADSSNWEYLNETKDGGKIWRYKQKQYTCGLILLDGHIAARNAYPFWDGEKYCTPDGRSKFDMTKQLNADLMFCSLVELEGMTPPCSVWNSDRTGYIYLRCDKGNPGDVFSQIELSVGYDLITTAEGGYNTFDNICQRCFAAAALDCNGHDHIIIQNCESCWQGGGVGYYEYDNGRAITSISGGGMLLFGCNVIGRNNYIHDCENKGIAVVNNGTNASGEASLRRKNVTAENNVIERCGKSIYMLTAFIPDGMKTVMEEIYFRNNYIINSGKGWRSHSEMWLDNSRSTAGSDCEAISLNCMNKTGKVLFENNLIYKPKGPCLMVLYKKDSEIADHASFKNNRFVLDQWRLVYEDAKLCETPDDEIRERRMLYMGEETDAELNRALMQLSP